jgi:hypothetical protein
MTDRDPIYDAMKQHSREKFDADRARFAAEAAAADDGGWVKHTEHHWSRTVAGKRLEYWPSRKKYQHDGRVMRGDVMAFIRKQQPKKPHTMPDGKTRNACAGPWISLEDMPKFLDFCAANGHETRLHRGIDSTGHQVKHQGHWMALPWNRNTKRYTADRRLSLIVQSFAAAKIQTQSEPNGATGDDDPWLSGDDMMGSAG